MEDSYLPAPSNRSPLEAFGDLKVSGGDLLEGAGTCTKTLSVTMVRSELM